MFSKFCSILTNVVSPLHLLRSYKLMWAGHLYVHDTINNRYLYGQFKTVGRILILTVFSESRTTTMPVTMCLDVFCVLRWKADAECQTVHSPLSHLASGSWMWRSGPKTSSIVTFFFRARLSSIPVKSITERQNKHECDVQYSSSYAYLSRCGDSWRKLQDVLQSCEIYSHFKRLGLLLSEQKLKKILWLFARGAAARLSPSRYIILFFSLWR